jgi:hypothetical protein
MKVDILASKVTYQPDQILANKQNEPLLTYQNQDQLKIQHIQVQRLMHWSRKIFTWKLEILL